MIPPRVVDFDEGVSAEELEFQGVFDEGSPFSTGAGTCNGILRLCICTGTDRNSADFVLRRTAEILRSL